MAVKFLSAEWATAVQDALNSHQGFRGAIASTDLGLQFNISGAPDGDIAYFMKAADGSAELALGELDAADVTIGQTYETATSIFKGDLNTQTAFMTGKLKVAGNLAKLMMNQNAITQMSAAIKGMEVEY